MKIVVRRTKPETLESYKESLRSARLVFKRKVELFKSTAMPVGTVRTHGGRKVKKLGLGKWVPIAEGTSRKGEGYQPLSLDRFVKARDVNLPPKYRPFVTPYSAAEYREKKARTYISQSGKSGYAVASDGDLISVFSAPGAHEGVEMVRDAIKHGAKKLDCLGDFLVKFYERFGFRAYERMKWNDDYAPANWDYKTNGRPDVIMMRLGGAVKKSKEDERQTKAFDKLSEDYVRHLFGNAYVDSVLKGSRRAQKGSK